MARSVSPGRFNGYDDDPIMQSAIYTQDINEQMRVPKRIRATGEYYDDHELLSTNGMNSWNYHEKLDMTVPDRIVVMGQDQHLGTRSAPREILLENQILPTNPGMVRVSTPPRVISLSEHHFPSASDDDYIRENGQGDYDSTNNENNDERRMVTVRTKKYGINPSELLISQASREATPPLGPSGEGLSPSEEVLHLRRQVAKLNRRVLAIELETVQRQQRDKIVYCVGLAYFLLKAIMWLNRN